AVRTPIAGQLFVSPEDLLYEDICFRQAVEIPFRIEQPVDVVDSQSSDLAFVDELQHVFVRGLEDLVPFGANPDQLTYIEEAAVINTVGRFPPMREAIMLARKDSVDSIRAEILTACRER